jgi:hypothetical protein
MNDSRFREMHKLNDDLLELFGSTKTLILNGYPWLKHVPLFDNFGYAQLKRTELKVDTYFCIIIIVTQMRELFYEPIDKYKQMLDKNPALEADNYCMSYLKEMRRRKDADESMDSFRWGVIPITREIYSVSGNCTLPSQICGAQG